MSRSNHYHWQVCTRRWHDVLDVMEGEIGEDGICEYHREYSFRHLKPCKPARVIPARRTWERKNKWGEMKYWTSPPPRCIKQLWNRRIRRIATEEFRRYGDIQTDLEKLKAGWYQWWD